jgi:hypothetical protein
MVMTTISPLVTVMTFAKLSDLKAVADALDALNSALQNAGLEVKAS